MPKAGQLLAHNFHKTISKFLDDAPQRSVEIAWIPGHKDTKGNDRADELAKAGAELASALPMVRSHTHVRRKATEKIQKEWVTEWENSPKTGRFAIANRISPSTKSTPHFRLLKDKREVFGRLVQCRTGNGYTGEYYSRMVPSENVDCPCGERLQTREHILRECPRYEAPFLIFPSPCHPVLRHLVPPHLSLVPQARLRTWALRVEFVSSRIW